MSGVAKDETNPTIPSDTTFTEPDGPEAPASEARGDASPHSNDGEALASGEADARNSSVRRSAPHLRVVVGNEGDDAAGPQQRIGAVIRSAREDLGLTLEAVSKDTRIHLSHLRAIEDMTPNLLGAPVYAKGYIKNYARHLKLDPEDTLARYLDECAILKDPEKQEIAPPATTRKLPVAAPVLGLLLVALAGGGAVMMLTSNDGPQLAAPIAASPDSAQSAVEAGLPVATTAAPPLQLVAVKRARIEVRGADGTKFLARFFSPGETYSPRVGAGWTVTTDDGAAFEWRLGEQSLGPLAAEGGPVFAQSVDLAVTRAPVAQPEPVAPDASSPAIAAATPPASQPAASQPLAASSPRTVRPRPEPQPPAASPPRAVAPAPIEEPPVLAPEAPPSDPAMLAYPEN